MESQIYVSHCHQVYVIFSGRFVECGFCGNLCKVYKYGQTKEMK